MATSGKIGVTTDNIFPVIKKFLYSDHEIFLRELVSNAVDATQKLRTLQTFGDFKGELTDADVRVTIDKEAGTLTVSDSGIGMTAEDIDRYINQIAFSGAEEFLEKYKDTANSIIGHFGLGFYSAFMVAKKVVIRSLSYKEGAKGVEWQCDGSPEFSMEECDKTTRGTDIILYIDDDNKRFLEQSDIDALLKKYCRFMPIPVKSGDKVINDTAPLWLRKPSELTDDDYRKFYHELYPGQDDPLFWIHLNVDYPFTLTGVLFFPKIKNNFEVTRNRIQLYCNQVYVTDEVEGVVPEFMMLLQGVIDSPDIPLNVSRSYLQSDTAVKKISGYITKKVSSRLEDIFKADRADFESKWDDIRLFIEYGMLTDQKFCDSAMKFCLVKDTEGKYFTLEQYRELIAGTQTDKNGDVVYIYTTDPVAQYSYIKAATDRGYNVIVMDGQLDAHFVGLLESKIEKSRFVRVDSESVDRLIPSAESREVNLTAEQRDMLTSLFQNQIPKVDKAEFLITFEALGAEANPIVMTQNEYMRRMKEMAAMQPGMSFYGELPDSYNLIVNTDSKVINDILTNADSALMPQLKPGFDAINNANERITAINSTVKDGKLTDEQSKEMKELEEKVSEQRNNQRTIAREYGSTQPLVRQVIDLALLANGMLRGAELQSFIRRSVELL